MIDPWYLQHLRCPVDGQPLEWSETTSTLISQQGLTYPVLDGVPVMLVREGDITIEGIKNSLRASSDDAPWYLESVFVTPEQRESIRERIREGATGIDPVAAYLVAATNGIGYSHLIGKYSDYPIPEIRLPSGDNKLLLDLGCSWGRWSFAAARKGWDVVGLDPSVGAVMAARRVARQLGLTNIRFVIGDARYLPFSSNLFDVVFSYSVIQHFSPEAARKTFAEAGRVLLPDGEALIQMPTKWGIRCLYNQIRRGFREPQRFEVRYRTLRELESLSTKTIGPTQFSVDCFFGIGWQVADLHIMPPSLKLVILASEALRKLSRVVPLLTRVADSVYVHATKQSV